MNKYIILFLINLLFIQCSKQDCDDYYKKYNSFDKFPIVEKWKFNTFSKNKYMLPPSTFSILDDRYLVLVNKKNHNIIHLYNIEKRELIKSFGNKGKGPGEYMGISDILYEKRNNRIFIYDATQKKFDIVNLTDILRQKRFKPNMTTKVSLDGGIPLRWEIINSDTLLATGGLNKRLCFYNSKFDTIKTEGYIPGNFSDRKDIFKYLTSTDIVKNDDEKKIAFGNRTNDILEIFRFNGKIKKTIHGPDINKPGWLASSSIPTGYFDLASSSKYIYCVYSGEKTNDKMDWIKTLGKNILIFNWEGKPIKKIELDHRIGDIVISEKNKTIYFIFYDGDYFRLGYHQLD